MNKWLRRIRGAIGMGITWAIGWGLVGVLIGASTTFLPEPLRSFLISGLDPWPALALPGFFGGVVFSTVLGIAGRRRRFDELSLLRFGGWGAVAGLLLSVVPAVAVAVGLASSAVNEWLFTAVIIGPVTLLSAGSAAGTLALARMTENRELLEASADVDEVGLTKDEVQELLGGEG